jgi:hypothetical protein
MEPGHDRIGELGPASLRRPQSTPQVALVFPKSNHREIVCRASVSFYVTRHCRDLIALVLGHVAWKRTHAAASPCGHAEPTPPLLPDSLHHAACATPSWLALYYVWCHRFLINPNRWSTRLTVVKSRSIWVLTSKNSPANSNDTFDLVDTCGTNPWSKPWSNPTQTLVTLDVFRNFCHVLQIPPKHFKIYLYESCPACWGTQLSCKLAFQILSGKAWKICSKVSISCSWQLSDIQSWQPFPTKSIEKNPI